MIMHMVQQVQRVCCVNVGVAELYKMFETMKAEADFDRRLKIVEDSNKSLTLTVKEIKTSQRHAGKSDRKTE